MSAYKFIHNRGSPSCQLTEMTSPTKLEHVTLHILRIVLQPPLRSVNLWVGTEDLLAPMQYPAIDGDSRTSWEPLASNLSSLWWDQSGDIQANSRANAHCLLQARLKVWQSLDFVPLWELTQTAGSCCAIDLLHKSCVYGWVTQNMVAEGLHGRSCGI